MPASRVVRSMLASFGRLARRRRNVVVMHRAAARPGRRATSDQIVDALRSEREAR
ncbi:MAG TPA: hypothetical protein VFI47_13350 [Acidimicrobiales bacterium]|nr:hypothetical protein [Acidimicrobiales bacterium]